MNSGIEAFAAAAAKSNADAMALMGKLFQVAEPGAVFSAPITAGDHTVITASEINIGMGIGFGTGAGGPAEEKAEATSGSESKTNGEGNGGGGGGGGGGFSAGRPVAAIIVSPAGVRVDPVVDVTKIAITFFTAMGAMFMAWRAMRGFGRR
jgi:uncharacterized spore protein YtfJ